jgi:hypothetical protein
MGNSNKSKIPAGISDRKKPRANQLRRQGSKSISPQTPPHTMR